MPLGRLPAVEICCGCIPDLKTAAAIIAVLGIVTSPAVSWAVVRHTYVIRVSCYISSSLTRPDVVDINLNNVLSFGFGTNAGLGPSCLSRNKTETVSSEAIFRSKSPSSKLVSAVRYIGWAVLIADLVFVCSSINLLIRIFRGPDAKAVKIFMIVAMIVMTISFVYCMLYVSACMSLGGSFPVIEFLFSFIDLFKWIIWIHFLLVMQTYYYSQFYKPIHSATIFSSWRDWLTSLIFFHNANASSRSSRRNRSVYVSASSNKRNEWKSRSSNRSVNSNRQSQWMGRGLNIANSSYQNRRTNRGNASPSNLQSRWTSPTNSRSNTPTRGSPTSTRRGSPSQ